MRIKLFLCVLQKECAPSLGEMLHCFDFHKLYLRYAVPLHAWAPLFHQQIAGPSCSLAHTWTYTWFFFWVLFTFISNGISKFSDWLKFAIRWQCHKYNEYSIKYFLLWFFFAYIVLNFSISLEWDDEHEKVCGTFCTRAEKRAKKAHHILVLYKLILKRTKKQTMSQVSRHRMCRDSRHLRGKRGKAKCDFSMLAIYWRVHSLWHWNFHLSARQLMTYLLIDCDVIFCQWKWRNWLSVGFFTFFVRLLLFLMTIVVAGSNLPVCYFAGGTLIDNFVVLLRMFWPCTASVTQKKIPNRFHRALCVCLTLTLA